MDASEDGEIPSSWKPRPKGVARLYTPSERAFVLEYAGRHNFGEQRIRLAVMWRRVSFGTQSERGNRFVERMLTVTATCRQQDRNVLDYVTAAVEAKLNGTAAPSLLPDRESMELALAA